MPSPRSPGGEPGWSTSCGRHHVRFCPAAARNSAEPRIWLAVRPNVCELTSQMNWFNSDVVAERFR